MKKQVMLIVVLLLLGSMVVAAEECDFWCKVGKFFSGEDAVAGKAEVRYG